MAVFLPDEFDKDIAISIINRNLALFGWSKKIARQKAEEHNKDLRDEYVDLNRHVLSRTC
jgi:hypothetical protein